MSRCVVAKTDVLLSVNKQMSNESIGKNTKVYICKKYRNALELEQRKMEQVVWAHINGWLKSGCSELAVERTSAMLNSIQRVLEAMGYETDKSLLLAAVIYAERYIQSTEQVDAAQCYQFLIVGAVIAAKMWFDTGIDFLFIAKAMEVDCKELASLELQFLAALNYELYITSQDIEIWASNSGAAP